MFAQHVETDQLAVMQYVELTPSWRATTARASPLARGLHHDENTLEPPIDRTRDTTTSEIRSLWCEK
jgi:hypothetical protein